MSPFIPTNHAVLRYQERVEALPMEAARDILNTPEIRHAVERGCQYYTLESGHRAIIQDRRIVTVLPRPNRST